jgi:hypothetical protein
LFCLLGDRLHGVAVSFTVPQVMWSFRMMRRNRWRRDGAVFVASIMDGFFARFCGDTFGLGIRLIGR